ncbi:barstar family protein [Lentzea sp. NPDC092896]|uniref:barstar family protein n=1 Tax=Lentzea sp. NPDC092896 TaxID=3364127 RepID=UPI00382EF5F2
MDGATRDVIVSAEHVSGFFVDEEDETEVVFRGVHQMGVTRKSEEGLLEVRDHRQEKIGEYYAGRVVRNDAAAEQSGNVVIGVPFRVFSNRCEVPQADEIWRRWASGVPLEPGEWSLRSVSYVEAWLHVVQNSWFSSWRAAACLGVDGTARLDGAQFSTRAGFYCALGEAVNGPGGYFGSNLDALVDCLRSSDAEQRLKRLEWRDFVQSERALGDGFMKTVAEIMREYSVDLVKR